MAKNTGKFKLSAEGRRAHANLCSDLKLIHQVNDMEAGKHYDAGNDAAGDESSRVAGAAKADAKKFGCKWAS